MSRNNLDLETSPYLLQHQENPVHWQPWGSEALDLAKHQDKPILLSVGYAACHWCHVMAHESFENAEIAALMNDLFINIKVDREERPDIDAIYQQALALTGEHGGWPLTMFLTPDGEPFWGGTYFPAEPRYGRPGFPDVLRRVADVYTNQPDAVLKNTAALVEVLQRNAAAKGEDDVIELSREILDQVAQRLAREVDPFLGGIGGAPKFPQPYAFEMLWRAYLRTGEEPYRQAVETTLDQMCQGGIYDHLGGGFSRYSTDDKWLAPHFEKMLYDNAQIVDLLSLVWKSTHKPLYEVRVRETVAWVLREMATGEGGFAATLDADSEGEEGKYYVWSELEINRLLEADADAFKSAYDVTAGGNWEGKSILNRSHQLALLSPDEEAALAEQRQRLFEARQGRIRPGWDDKVLADWNGLMIAALTNAATAFEMPDWLDAAERAFHFVATGMSENGRLKHSYRAGQLKHSAMLDDYANMCRAALALFEATGTAAYLEQAEAWAAVANQHYGDDDGGGYYFTADDAGDLISRQRHCHDNAVPSGNGTMAGVLTRLWLLTGKIPYRERADRLFQAFSGELRRNFFPLTTFLNSLELMLAPVQVAIVGGRDDSAVKGMLNVVYAHPLPNRVLQIVAPEQALPSTHPAHGKAQIGDQPTAYVCHGAVCSMPLADTDALAEALTSAPTSD